MRFYIILFLLLTFKVSADLPETLKEASKKIKSSAPGTLFIKNEKLIFTTSPDVKLPAYWHVKDWYGNTCARGINRWGEIIIPNLPVGYYNLHHNGLSGKRTFAIVEKTTANPAGYFALCGSLFSTILRYSLNLMRNNPLCPDPVKSRKLLSELPKRLGSPMVREIMHWHRVEPAPGKFDWLYHISCAKELQKKEIGLNLMIPYQPNFYTAKGATLPENLMALYRFSKETAKTFKNLVNVLEYSNEPDLAWIKEAPWDYVSAMKAAYLGYKEGNPNVKVTNGGIAFANLNSYTIEMLNNGLGDYIDIFNVHTYADLREYNGIMNNMRQVMDKYNISHLPIWFTENGGWAEGLAECDNIMRGNKAHSEKQEKIMAEYLPKMMILLQSYGVNRDFAFSLSAYNENAGAKDWGLLRRDYTIKPALAVFANLTAKLGHQKYIGTIHLGKGIKGFLYEDSLKKQTLVFWSESELDTKVSQPNLKLDNNFEKKFILPQKNGNYTIYNEVGTPSSIKSTNEQIALTSCRNIRILTGLSGLVATNLVDIPKQKINHKEYDKTIVFRAIPSKDFKLSDNRVYLEVPQKTAPFFVEILNFSQIEKKGTINILGGKDKIIKQNINIPAMEKKVISFNFLPELDKNFNGRMLVSGIFNNQKTGILSIPFSSTSARKANCKEVDFPGLLNPKAWNIKNSAGTMTCSFDSNEKALTFTVKFPKGAPHWTAPEYLLQIPQETLSGALGITFEAKTNNSKGIFVNGIQLADRDRKYVSLRVPKYTSNWEKRTVWFDSQSIIKPSDARYLRFGLNTHDTCFNLSYSVRNIKLLYP